MSTIATVRNCPLPSDCGQRWRQLDPIRAQPDLRFCLRCQRAVHRCRLEPDASLQAARGRVVLVESTGTPADTASAMEASGWR